MYHRNRVGGPTGPYAPSHDYLEEQNNDREEELKGKVSALKSLSIDIGAEVREHNRLLKDVDDDFDSTSGLLGKSISKVLQLAKSSHRYYFLYLFFFCIFVFLVLWFVI